MPPEPVIRELPHSVDVLIVGAGFMGRWLAYFLSRLNPAPSVLVLERDRFTYGASSRNAGFLTCGQVSEMLADVETAGEPAVVETFLQRREGIALARREMPDLEFDACGSVDYDELTPAKHDLAERLNAACGEQVYSVRDMRFRGNARPAIFNQEDGGLHPVRLLNALQERSGGVQFAFGVDVEHVANGTCSLRGARSITYRHAFVCANGFARMLDAASPVVPGRGQVIVTSPVMTETQHALGYLDKGYDYFRFVDGRLLLGGGRDKFSAEQDVDALETTLEVREHLHAVARNIIGHDDWTIDYHWAGIMGFIGGGHLGGSPRRILDAQTEAVAGFGGMGVALTPLIAQQIARQL